MGGAGEIHFQTLQLADAKKRTDDIQQELEEMQNAKRKQDKEVEALQDNIDQLTAENNKLARSKKKIQEEVGTEE